MAFKPDLFLSMNKQKILKNYLNKDKDNFKNSEYLSKYGLYLPSYSSLKKKDIKWIATQVNNILN